MKIITQAEFKKLTPPILALPIGRLTYVNLGNSIQGFNQPHIYYAIGKSIVSETFPILHPDYSGCSMDMVGRWVENAGQSIPVSDLATSRDYLTEAEDDDRYYIIYEKSDINILIGKLKLLCEE